MFWEVLWPLAVGFILSAVVQTVVSKAAITRALPPVRCASRNGHPPLYAAGHITP